MQATTAGTLKINRKVIDGGHSIAYFWTGKNKKDYAALVVPAKRVLFPPYSFAASYYWPEEKPAAKAAKN